MTTRWPGHGVLVVPVPPLEAWVRERTAWYDRDYLSADEAFCHAHVTVLAPFVDHDHADDDTLTRVDAVLAGHEPFRLRLDAVTTEPGGWVVLRPDPVTPLLRLTRNLETAFPELPMPSDPVPRERPHLTLDRLGPEVDEDSVRASVAHLLPVDVAVSQVSWSWYEQGRCHEVARWSLRRPTSRRGPARP